MTERSYIPLTLDFLERYEELSHEEMGRLIRALLAYAKGADPSPYLTENLQKYCFRAEKDMLDRTMKAYESQLERRKAASQKANEAKKAAMQSAPNGTERSRPVPNRMYNNNNNKNNNNNNNNSGGANSVRRTDYPSGTHGPVGGETVL